MCPLFAALNSQSTYHNQRDNDTSTLADDSEADATLTYLLGDPTIHRDGTVEDEFAPAHGIHWSDINKRVKEYTTANNPNADLHGCATCGIRQYEDDNFKYKRFEATDPSVRCIIYD